MVQWDFVLAVVRSGRHAQYVCSRCRCLVLNVIHEHIYVSVCLDAWVVGCSGGSIWGVIKIELTCIQLFQRKLLRPTDRVKYIGVVYQGLMWGYLWLRRTRATATNNDHTE